MRLAIFGIFFFLGLFLLQAGISRNRSNLQQSEEARATTILHYLSALNRPALQNQAEFLATLGDIPGTPGMMTAFVADQEGNILVHLENQNKKGGIKLEETIFGFDQKPLGKAVLYFQPVLPAYSFFWTLFALFSSAGFYFFHLENKRNAPKTAKAPKIPCEESYWWIPVLSASLAKTLAVFDAQGNVLASSHPQGIKHILDLFSDPQKAQDILRLIDTLEKEKGDLLPLPGQPGLAIGYGKISEEAYRYLLVWDSPCLPA